VIFSEKRRGFFFDRNVNHSWAWKHFCSIWVDDNINDIANDIWVEFQKRCALKSIPFSSIIMFWDTLFWRQNLRYTPVSTTNRSWNRRNTLHIRDINTDWSGCPEYFRENVRNENTTDGGGNRRVRDRIDGSNVGYSTRCGNTSEITSESTDWDCVGGFVEW
jgi:hypothetical protein